MTSLTAEAIREAALQLSENERVQLAAELLESLPAQPIRSSEELQAVLARRIEEIDAGQVTMIPWEEVRRGLHRET